MYKFKKMNLSGQAGSRMFVPSKRLYKKMKQIISKCYLLLAALWLSLSGVQSQDTVKLFLDASRTGDTIQLQLTAQNFIGVESFEITFNYPGAELNYSSVLLHPQLNFQTDVKDSNFLRFSWINPNAFPLTLNDNSVLAEFKFYIEKKSVQTCFDFDVSTRPTGFLGTLSTLIPSQTNGICKNLFGGLVQGIIRMDTDGDCQGSASEPAMQSTLLRFISNAGTFYAITNEDGYFQRYLPFNNYSVNTVNNEFLQSCTGSSNLDLINNVSLNLSPASTAKLNCPLLETEFIALQLEICKSNEAGLRFYNKGTQDVSNVYIDLELDPFLSIESSSNNYTILSPTSFRFNIGVVKAQTSGQIQLVLKSACNNSFAGRTVQNIARIFPNDYCNAPTNFSGAELQIIPACIGNENVFEIKNVGTGNMKTEIVFNTVEDDIMPNFGGKVKLDIDASQFIRYPANGKTRIIIIDTIANHPYQVRAFAASEACGIGTVSKGYVNNYAQGDESPSISRYSTELKALSNTALNITSIPEGVGASRFISNSDRIRYGFVVKNITSGFVNRVVIRNKIPTTLDITTLQLAKTESNFTWSIQDDRVLEIVFEGLNLTSANDNELLSQFTFSYSIKPNSENNFNTKIENTAEIILDSKVKYNSNQTLHTIGNFIFTILNDNQNEEVRINIFPNPCEERLSFNFFKEANYTIQFFNQYGKRISTELTTQSQFTTSALVNEASGVYYYLISKDNRKHCTGKVIKSTK